MITNYSGDAEYEVSVENEDLVEYNLQESFIFYKSKGAVGETTLTISAKGWISKTVKITILEKFQIETDVDEVEVNGDSEKITITNAKEVNDMTGKWPSGYSENEEIAKVGYYGVPSYPVLLVRYVSQGETNAIVELKDNDNFIPKKVKIIAKEVPQLSTIITKTELGLMKSESDEYILNAMEELNPEAKGKTKIVENKSQIATFEAINKNEYKGNVVCTYTYRKTKIDVKTDTLYLFSPNKDDVTSVIINNYNDLYNVTVIPENEKLISLVVSQTGMITLNHKDIDGETSITINAENAIKPITIKVIIRSVLDIEIDNNYVHVYLGETSKNYIKNWSSLINNKQNVEVKSKDENVATAIIKGSGEVLVSGISEGLTKIILSCGQCTETEFDVNVTKRAQIDVNTDDLHLNSKIKDDMVAVKINNYQELEGLKLTTENNKIIEATIEDYGYISATHKGVDGWTNLFISAENAVESVTIKVIVSSE